MEILAIHYSHMNSKKIDISGIISLLCASFIYGFFGILSRGIGVNQLPLYYTSGLRALFAALLLSFLLLYMRAWKKINKKDLGIIALRGICSVMSVIAFFVAVNYLPINTAYFILYAGATLGGYSLGSILFKEKLTLIKIIALLFSLVGLYFIYLFSLDATKAIYIGFALISGIATALWDILPKKISHTYSSVQLSFLDNIIGGVFALLVSLLLREQWTIPSLTTAWELNALFGSLFVATGLLIIYGFRRLDAQIGSLVMLAEVLFAILLAFIFYGEIITPIMFVGGTLILVGIILPKIKELSVNRLEKMN